jgi:hypothetical protein
MKRILLTTFISILFSSVISFSQSAPDEKLLIGMFDGRTPCQELAKQLKQPTIQECIKIKWRLHLYRDAESSGKGTFIVQGFTFRDQNKLTGQWNLVKGTSADPDALVYELVIPGRENLLLQQVDDNLLIFLDHQKNLMVGNRDFSYVLSRAEPKKVL